MPTILRINGFRFVIWPNDHLPPHLHVFKAGTEVIIELGIGDDSPSVRVVYRMSSRDIESAMAITLAQNYMFLERWRNVYKNEHKGT